MRQDNPLVNSLVGLQSNAPSLLEALVGNFPASYFVVNKNWQIVECNDHQAQVLNYQKREDIIGLDTRDFADHLDWSNQIVESIHHNNEVVVRQEQSQTFYEKLLLKSGWVNTICIKLPYRSRQNEIIGIQGLSLNLSQLLNASMIQHIITDIFNYTHLTPREMDCITHCILGLSNKEIANKLNISTHTVNEYFKNIRLKTGHNTKSELVSTILPRLFNML